MNEIDYLIKNKLNDVCIKDVKEWEYATLNNSELSQSSVTIINNTNKIILVDSIYASWNASTYKVGYIDFFTTGMDLKQRSILPLIQYSSTVLIGYIQYNKPHVLKPNESVRFACSSSVGNKYILLNYRI